MRSPNSPLYDALKTYFDRYQKVGLPIRAAALAYHTLLAIVPVLGLIFWYLQHIGLAHHWLVLTKNYLLSQLNLDPSSQVLRTFEALTDQVQGSTWGLVVLVLLLYTACNLVWRFGEALDAIINTGEHPPPKKISHARLILNRLAAMLGLPIALTLSLVVTSWIRNDSLLRAIFRQDTVGPIVALPVAWCVDILALFVAYYMIPRSPVPWKQALKAAAIAGPVSELLRHLFSLYNVHAVLKQRIYGVFAVIPMFILWVQLAWWVLLMAALWIRFPPEPEESEVKRG